MSLFLDIRVDAATVRALRRRDRQAQEAVYRAYADAVYSLASRMLRDRAAAEDATQDTFVEVLRAGHKLAKPEALGAWIRAVAVNQCRSRLRSPWRTRRVDGSADSFEPERPSDSDSIGMERAADVERALGRLSPAPRLVVWLYCVEGYTHREIGRIFGRTASFSKSQLARALRALAEQREAKTARLGRAGCAQALRGAPAEDAPAATRCAPAVVANAS